MSSISDQLRAALTMTSVEADDLIKRGYAREVVESLCDRGFREACPMPHDDGSTSPSFLRQTSLPHLHIIVEKSATLEDLDNAIHDHAYRQGYQSLADLWHRFTDSVKSWHRPQKQPDLEARGLVFCKTWDGHRSDECPECQGTGERSDPGNAKSAGTDASEKTL